MLTTLHSAAELRIVTATIKHGISAYKLAFRATNIDVRWEFNLAISAYQKTCNHPCCTPLRSLNMHSLNKYCTVSSVGTELDRLYS